MGGRKRIAALEGFLLLVLGSFALAFFVETRELGQTAALFPRLVALASLAALALALGFQFFGAAKARQTPAETAALETLDVVSWPLALAVQVGYVALIALLGFSLASLLYLIGAPLQMRYRRWGVLIAYGFLLTAAVAIAFTVLFHVRLPEGLLWSYLKG
ncbi:MAG: tripartite tricarboxylate transporter TctB family protein [Betaproteobacteria bacterium]|nr:tripartite tricarboxylate transporter TctB family protein [Betaproteobacteria bacterium]